MFVIKSDYGYVRGFDGEDYFWTSNRAAAWKMSWFESNLVYNRLVKIPGVVREPV